MTINIKLNGKQIDVKHELTKIYNRNNKIIDFFVLYIALAIMTLVMVEGFNMGMS